MVNTTGYRYGLGMVLVVAWLVATGYAFWYFQLQYVRPFDVESRATQSHWFEADALAASILEQIEFTNRTDRGRALATVINLWDPGCACSRFSAAHVRDLIERFSDQGVRFVVVAPSPLDERAIAKARATFGSDAMIGHFGGTEWARAVPASPAAIVLDEQHHIRYFGPYSNDAFCSSEGGAFVEVTLDHLLGHSVRDPAVNVLASGCFCDWKPERTVAGGPHTIIMSAEVSA
ncbi:MAG: DUF6436 domain-containing protein [Thiotrichales bacterium]